MTVLDEPLVDIAGPATTPASPRPATVSTATWRFAARLARREVRRRPGRTLLVLLLVMLPVVAMSLASIVARTSVESATERFAREFGTADLMVQPLRADGSTDATADVFGSGSPVLPERALTTDFVTLFTPVVVGPSERVANVKFTDVDLTSPITASLVEVSSGRAPEDSSEVLVSPDIVRRFGLGVGDRLRLLRPDVDAEIVGIGRDGSDGNQSLIVVGQFDRTLLRPGWGQRVVLIDVPASTPPAEVATLARAFGATAGVVTPTDYFGDNDVAAKDLAWGWVAGVLGFVMVGIVIAAAFATSARRQLVTIGQLSANGASPRLVRRTMAMQGMWSGVFGAAAGIAVAVIGAVVAFRLGVVDEFVGRSVDTLDVRALDLLVIGGTAVIAATVAALVPARSAARIPVLTALSGRRPVSEPPAWMAPSGVALFLGGLFLLGGVAAVDEPGDFEALLGVIGGLGVLFGIVCASPILVAGVARVGARRGGVARLAARSIGRSRARSAAVLTAIAVVGAAATVGSTATSSAQRADTEYVPDLRTVTVNFATDWFGTEAINQQTDPASVVDQPPIVPTPLPDTVRSIIEQVLPDATWTPITQVIDDPQPYRVDGMPMAGSGVANGVFRVVVVDEAVSDRLELTDAQREILDIDGVLSLTPWYGSDAVIYTPSGPVDIDLSASMELLGFDDAPMTDAEFERAAAVTREVPRYFGDIFVSERLVSDLGLAAAVMRYVVSNPSDLTDGQRDALYETQPTGFDDAFVLAAVAPGYDSPVNPEGDVWYASFDAPANTTPWALIQLGVAIASLLLVLGVVAVGLSLGATESRDERDVLHAVGASPRTLRRLAAAKAWVLTTGAAVIAVPAGYVTIFVVTKASDASAPFPFAIAAALLFVIPVVTAGITLAVSGLAQRFRPVTYSTLATEV